MLADALVVRARSRGATHLLDLATLTGAIVVALGDFYAGLLGNDEAWISEIRAAAEASGDHAWLLPLHETYRRYIQSTFADMKNSSDLRQAGPIYAARFLQEFAGEGPWAHLDIAGTALLERSRGDYYTAKGATGYGVRLIAELAERAGAADEPRPRRGARAPAPHGARVRRGADRAVADELDREHRFPYEIVAGLAELGAHGRSRSPRSTAAAALDTLSLCARHRGAGARRLVGRDHRRRAHVARDDADPTSSGPRSRERDWLPDLASGRRLAAFGLTEPGAGSDAGATRTTRRAPRRPWVVNGSKIFITNAGTDITACVTITAVTGERDGDRRSRT